MALVYLVNRLGYRVLDFFHHWYYHGSRVITNYFFLVLERLDRGLAFKITLKHFFEPLYKDYTVIGRILGVIFRTFRILIGFFVYAVFAVCFALVYLVWILFLPAVFFLFVRGFFYNE